MIYLFYRGGIGQILLLAQFDLLYPKRPNYGFLSNSTTIIIVMRCYH